MGAGGVSRIPHDIGSARSGLINKLLEIKGNAFLLVFVSGLHEGYQTRARVMTVTV